MQAAAFSATYSDFRIVKGRKCAQIVLEVPIEAADAALAALGGVPRPDAEVWVGVARIDPTKAASEPRKAISGPSDRERQKWRELPPAKQAAIRCKEIPFQRFLAETQKSIAADEEAASEAVRETCRVTTRANILEGTKAALEWRKLDEQYLAWREVG